MSTSSSKLSLSISNSTLDLLELKLSEISQRCQQTEDRELHKLKYEYSRLFKILRQSFDNEKRIQEKIIQLTEEKDLNDTKIQYAQVESKSDKQTITNLKSQVESLWSSVEKGTEVEDQNKKLLDELSNKIQNLNKINKEGQQKQTHMSLEISIKDNKLTELSSIINDIKNGITVQETKRDHLLNDATENEKITNSTVNELNDLKEKLQNERESYASNTKLRLELENRANLLQKYVLDINIDSYIIDNELRSV